MLSEALKKYLKNEDSAIEAARAAVRQHIFHVYAGRFLTPSISILNFAFDESIIDIV